MNPRNHRYDSNYYSKLHISITRIYLRIHENTLNLTISCPLPLFTCRKLIYMKTAPFVQVKTGTLVNPRTTCTGHVAWWKNIPLATSPKTIPKWSFSKFATSIHTTLTASENCEKIFHRRIFVLEIQSDSRGNVINHLIHKQLVNTVLWAKSGTEVIRKGDFFTQVTPLSEKSFFSINILL